MGGASRANHTMESLNYISHLTLSHPSYTPVPLPPPDGTIDLEEWRVGFTSGLLKQPLPGGDNAKSPQAPKKEHKEEAKMAR